MRGQRATKRILKRTGAVLDYPEPTSCFDTLIAARRGRIRPSLEKWRRDHPTKVQKERRAALAAYAKPFLEAGRLPCVLIPRDTRDEEEREQWRASQLKEPGERLPDLMRECAPTFEQLRQLAAIEAENEKNPGRPMSYSRKAGFDYRDADRRSEAVAVEEFDFDKVDQQLRESHRP